MAKRVRFGTGIGRHESMHEVAEHAVAAEQYGMEHLTILRYPVDPGCVRNASGCGCVDVEDSFGNWSYTH